MSETKFPYEGWVLMPSFKPAQVYFVNAASDWGSLVEWHVAESGKCHHVHKIHPDKQAAIAAGRAKLAVMQAKIHKQLAGMAKKAAALDKAEHA